MENFLAFVEIGGAILLSMGLAMWLEWYCLRWLMRLMPGRMQAGALASSTAITEAAEAVRTAESEDRFRLSDRTKAA
jgi:hypothetical protein